MSKVKEFVDNNFKFHENWQKVLQRDRKQVGEGEIAHYEQFLLFQQCYQ